MKKLDGSMIERLMVEKKFTIRDLAKAASITEVTARRLMDGGRANLRTLSKVAAALGVDYRALLTEGVVDDE